jgi:hypothetical protein
MYQMLNDFRYLTPPPKEALDKRNELVKALVAQMGHKYRLATPMPRVQ